ncbi:hypothetical protein H8E50_01930 [bacterium]|nr:hypothetical protein [bacterium]
MESSLRMPVSVIITDNTTSMLSFVPAGERLRLRLHRMFLSAGPEVLAELVEYVQDHSRKTPHITSFIRDNRYRIKKTPVRESLLKPEGRQYDLRDISERLNEKYFAGRINVSVTWGARRSGKRRIRTLGSYVIEKNLIRINPILDSVRVPSFFIEYVMYHELLHADIGVKVKNGRRAMHTPEFRRRERLYEFYEKANAWERRL